MKKINLYMLISILFVISIPMQPIVTKYVFYFLAFLVCIFTLALYIKNEKDLRFTSYERMEILFILFMIATLVMGGHFYEKLKYVFGIIRYFIFISCLIRLLDFSIKKEEGQEKNQQERKKKIISIILNSFTIGTVIASIYVLIKEPSINGNYGRMGRVVYGGDNGGYIIYSYNLIISVFWSLYNFMRKDLPVRNKRIYLYAIILLVPCMLLNGTKKTLFSLAIYFFGYIFLNNKDVVKKFMYIIATILVILMLYKVVTTNVYLNSIIGYRLSSFINSSILKDTTLADASTSERAAMRKEAFNYFLSSPIWGNGISSFMYYFGDKYGSYLYAHNNYLELLADLGLIGFSIHYLWVVKTIVNLYKERKNDNSGFCNYLLLFIISTLILEYGTVTFDQLHYILMFQLCSYFIEINKEDRKNDVNVKNEAIFY